MEHEFDNEASLREAKARLPLNRLMEQHGDPPPPIGMKWSACPICKKKSTARITDDGQQQFFKCANSTCPSQTSGEGEAWTELKYLTYKTGLKGKDVFVAYLKEANVWKERERYKSPEPESAPAPKQEAPMQEAPSEPADTDAGEVDDEDLIQKCIEVILLEQRASVKILQRRLRLGYTRATRIMNELEKRGIVGPSKGAEPRDILIQKAATPAEPPIDGLDDYIEAWFIYLRTAKKEKFKFVDLENSLTFEKAAAVLKALLERNIVRQIGDEYELVAQPAPTVALVTATPAQAPRPAPPKVDGEDGYAALHDFFSDSMLSERDDKKLFELRGLKSATSERLSFLSNPRSNRGRLLKMMDRFGKDELLQSGLCVRVKGKPGLIKPNSQFCGAGIIRKTKPGEKSERNQWIDNDGNLWGWCEPILIPYFDEVGRLVGLRPHKGGGLANTLTGSPRIYVPRVFREVGKKIEEYFPRVVITEGEFKAASLWQTIGAGRIDGNEPYGVVAVPGIWFSQNYAIREELDQWLRDVRCRVVKVAYDNEEKGNPELESYKTDRRKRFDAEICARVLATDIANKLHIRGEVCRLPDAWRNQKGKADWDGALVKITQPKPIAA